MRGFKRGRFLFGPDAKFSQSFGSWQTTSSAGKGPGAQTSHRLSRKMSYFCRIVAALRVFVVVFFPPCGSQSQNQSKRDAFGMCGEDLNRLGL